MKILFLIIIAVLFQLSSAIAQNGCFLILKNVYVHEDVKGRSNRILMRKRQAYNVVNIHMADNKSIVFQIIDWEDQYSVNGSGYIIEAENQLQKLGQQLVKVYPEVLKTDSDLTRYQTVPANQLSYSGIQDTSPDFPNIIWRAVNYKTLIPRKYWVAEWAGIYRPDRSAEWMNKIYRQIVKQKLDENLTRKILMGLVETGFTREQVKMALGDPIQEQPMEQANQVTWIYSSKKIIFQDGMVRQVL